MRSSESRHSAFRPIQGFLLLSSIMIAIGGCMRQPYTVVKVQGNVAYEDGSLIPVERLVVRFEPLVDPINERTYPRSGVAYVNSDDGSFSYATTYDFGDGIVFGQHRVIVVAANSSPLDKEAIPSEYSDSKRTPIVVDTANQPFEIRIPKPE